ncbi:MAG: hypothetical protein IJV64_09775 [Oscillospiraceae bacterium]|nr:hypothetical protein [Oscillospiraceae bacterium]
MKNTHVEYSSAERTPTVLPEFAGLLPPLTEEQLDALEKDIVANGCYAPVIVNEDMVVIDGHSRKSICEKHNIPYRMAVFSVEDALEAKQWALDTQKGRRNLDKWELGKIALKLRPDIEARAKANKGTRTDLSATLPEGYSATDTRRELADSVGIGERTMGKVMQIDDNAPEAVRKALDDRELSVNQGYLITKQIQALPEEEREEAAMLAVEMEKARKELREKDAEMDRRTRIARLFSKAFEYAIQIDPAEENVRIWTECTRMLPAEIAENISEADELSQTFHEIADRLREIRDGRQAA